MMDWLVRPFRPAARLEADPAKVERITREIDEHYDAMLVDGMPMAQVMRVERQRRETHELVKKAVLELAAGQRDAI